MCRVGLDLDQARLIFLSYIDPSLARIDTWAFKPFKKLKNESK